MAKSFKIKTDSEQFGESTYQVGANTKEEAQQVLIANFPSIESDDGDPYDLPEGKREIVDSVEEMRGVEFEHGKAERLYL